MAVLKSSEVTVQLDDAARLIDGVRKTLHAGRLMFSSKCATLTDIPNVYADLLETINAVGYGGTNAVELANKAQLAKLTTEFNALLTRATVCRDYMDASIAEF